MCQYFDRWWFVNKMHWNWILDSISKFCTSLLAVCCYSIEPAHLVGSDTGLPARARDCPNTGKKPYWKITLFFFSLLLVCLYCSFIALHFFHVANFLQVFWYQSLRPHLPNTQFKAVMCNDDDVANLPVSLPAYPRKKKKESAIKWTTNLSFLSKYFHEKCQKCKS